MASTNAGQRPLKGKLALVTGASRGIGVAICRNLASKGANIIINYTTRSSESLAETLVKTLQTEFGVHAMTVQADMGDPQGPDFLFNQARSICASRKLHHSNIPGLEESQVFQLDIIVNNAGVAGNFPISDCTAEEFDRQYKVNVLGPLLLMKAALPYLPQDRSGRIINISSVSSSLGFDSQSIYGGTKAALDAMTRTWARELVERATVNSITPGPVATEMWYSTTPEFRSKLRPWMQIAPGSRIRPEIDEKVLVDDAEVAGGRPAYVEEVAGVVGMLCTPDAGWCTGQVVCANGGMSM